VSISSGLTGALLLGLFGVAPGEEKFRDSLAEYAQTSGLTVGGSRQHPTLRADDACSTEWAGTTMALTLAVAVAGAWVAAFLWRVHSIDGWPMVLYAGLVSAGALMAFVLEAMGS